MARFFSKKRSTKRLNHVLSSSWDSLLEPVQVLSFKPIVDRGHYISLHDLEDDIDGRRVTPVTVTNTRNCQNELHISTSPDSSSSDVRSCNEQTNLSCVSNASTVCSDSHTAVTSDYDADYQDTGDDPKLGTSTVDSGWDQVTKWKSLDNEHLFMYLDLLFGCPDQSAELLGASRSSTCSLDRMSDNSHADTLDGLDVAGSLEDTLEGGDIPESFEDKLEGDIPELFEDKLAIDIPDSLGDKLGIDISGVLLDRLGIDVPESFEDKLEVDDIPDSLKDKLEVDDIPDSREDKLGVDIADSLEDKLGVDIPDSLTDKLFPGTNKQEELSDNCFSVGESDSGSDSSVGSPEFGLAHELPVHGATPPRNKVLENIGLSYCESRSLTDLTTVGKASRRIKSDAGSSSLRGSKELSIFSPIKGQVIRPSTQPRSHSTPHIWSRSPLEVESGIKKNGSKLSQQQLNESSERYHKEAAVKEERKQKSGVLNKIQSFSLKPKKEKVKSESHQHHRFVTVAFSYPPSCDVCRKSMANKAALRCEDCLLTVHEQNCKDNVAGCDKRRNEVLHKEIFTYGGLGTIPITEGMMVEQRPAHIGSSLRHTVSMISTRPSTINIRSQQSYMSPSRQVLEKSLSTSSKSMIAETDASTFSMTDSRKASDDSIGGESLESPDGAIPPEFYINDEPALGLLEEYPETWISTVPDEVHKKLSKMDIERQNNIWELIGKEKQYVKRLKIIQKIFARSMIHDLNYSESKVQQLFPRLDEIVELHTNFLRQLLNRQARNENRFVDEIGDILVSQFQGSTGEKMKSVYGTFCSRKAEAVELYKELVKEDKKFQNFIKRCHKYSICEKLEIPAFILIVAMRPTKYRIPMEETLKNTKDKKDRESLNQAVLSCKDVVQQIDQKVASYLKLKDIQHKIDTRTVIFRDKKFTRMDLTANNRELLHVGIIGWQITKDRVVEVKMLVLNDLLVFLQKNEQRLTLLPQDNKLPVISLHGLIVKRRETSRDQRGIFLLSPDTKHAAMYELVCQNTKFREDWMRILQNAVDACPADNQPVLWPSVSSGTVSESVLERRRKLEYSSRAKDIIVQLHEKDEIIKECCDAKSKLMMKVLELTASQSQSGDGARSQGVNSLSELVDIIQAAMIEASHLTNILQGSGTALNRTTSSTAENQSSTFLRTTLPKRSETFSGTPAGHVPGSIRRPYNDLLANQEQDECEQQQQRLNTPSQNFHGSSLDLHNTSPGFKYESDSQIWRDPNTDCDQESLGELSGSMTSLVPPGQEQMTSVFHLVRHLNALMNLTSKQCTTVEILRLELADAKEKIAKLSTEMQHNHLVHCHEQLEELKSLQESINLGKQEWETQKFLDFAKLEKERKMMVHELIHMKEEKKSLDVYIENLKKEQKALQNQIEKLRERDLPSFPNREKDLPSFPNREKDLPSFPNREKDLPSFPNNNDNFYLYNGSNNNSTRLPIIHQKSASADYYDSLYVSDFESIQSSPLYQWVPNTRDSLPVSSSDLHEGQNSDAPTDHTQNKFLLHSNHSHNDMDNNDVEQLPISWI